MKKIRDLRLSTKFMTSIGLILVVLTVFDVWFSMRKEKDIMYRDIKKWTFVFAENVRTTLNTLMREDKMNLRFAMLESMSKEIKGVNNVRIIRGPRVNEIFAKVNRDDILPKEEAALGRYMRQMEELQKDLSKTKDEDEINDIKDEIDSLQGNLKKVRAQIDKAKVPLVVDERETMKDDLDREVIRGGEPVYSFEGDKARVLVPYIVKKNCTTASGCHKYAGEGDVLGAISMEFSTAEIKKEILKSNIETAGLGVLRLAIVLGVLVFFLTVLVIRNINTMLLGFKRLAEGDFSNRLPVTSGDEMGKLASGFNGFLDEFNGVIKEIHGASGEIAATSENLSVSSSQIAKGTESQKLKTAQVATSSEELSATINDIAQNSQSAADSAKDTHEAAQKGGRVVSKSVEGMNGILPIVRDSADIMAQLGDRSNDIGKIIGVINDIADQTNLLALNAAIEAARAGEQGRGFAVVADEVKKLAERTTRATKEVSQMVRGIQNDTSRARSSMENEVRAVEDAVGLAGETGTALSEIMSHVDKLTEMIQHIATSSEQQSTAASQISGDIESVAGVANDTANDAGHIATAAVDLSKLSAKLRKMTSRFKIGEGTDDGVQADRLEDKKRNLKVVKFKAG